MYGEYVRVEGGREREGCSGARRSHLGLLIVNSRLLYIMLAFFEHFSGIFQEFFF